MCKKLFFVIATIFIILTVSDGLYAESFHVGPGDVLEVSVGGMKTSVVNW